MNESASNALASRFSLTKSGKIILILTAALALIFFIIGAVILAGGSKEPDIEDTVYWETARQYYYAEKGDDFVCTYTNYNHDGVYIYVSNVSEVVVKDARGNRLTVYYCGRSISVGNTYYDIYYYVDVDPYEDYTIEFSAEKNDTVRLLVGEARQ